MRHPVRLPLAVLLGLLAPGALRAQDVLPVVPLRAGLVVTASARIAPGVYRIAAPAAPDSAVVTVRGDGVTLDLTGVTLVGADPAGPPDAAAGVAVRVVGGRDVTVRGGRVRGYRVGVLAERTRGFRLVGADLSHSWKPRLFSGAAHESLVDWLSFHRNDAGEWRRFGAAVYLDGVTGGEVRGVRATQGMNGVMLVRTDSVRVVGNEVAFNSGVGIGLYRSSGNAVLHNLAAFNVRGYRHGVYRRGQDSAALVVYEQSHGNVVAFNAMTHSGDGLFLWAGQTTMDTGRGGANDNLFYANDFSYAPTNGMEATFSRNAFVGNRVVGSDHGLWGGYSFDSDVVGNHFGGNRIGIAIEHGQGNRIAGNVFDGDGTAVRLWANPGPPPAGWGYPQRRDTRSRGYRIEGNAFARHRVGLDVARTESLTVTGNRFAETARVFAWGPDTAAVWVAGNDTVAAALGLVAPDVPPGLRLPAPLPGAFDPAASPYARWDRSAIVVTEWGPYDYRAPLLWSADTARAGPRRFRVLGPPGAWRVAARDGLARVTPERGGVGDTLRVEPLPGRAGDWRLDLTYTGAATVTARGDSAAAGVPVRFGHDHFAPPIRWAARFHAWPDTTDLRAHPEAFGSRFGGPVLAERWLDRLDLFGARSVLPGLPTERWALDATGEVTLPPGRYTLRTISDDAVRVWVDGRLVIDHAAPHDAAVDTAPLGGGRHTLRVQYVQVDGWTELRLDLLRGDDRSTGSPGPH